MGVRRLKIKDELHYRRGTTAHDCSECNHFVRDCHLWVGGEIKVEPRCRIIGLKEGRLYRINPGSICDRHDSSESLKRLRGY